MVAGYLRVLKHVESFGYVRAGTTALTQEFR
jgi:hypothetical protein